jgi:chaperone modulatory protein CbpM
MNSQKLILIDTLCTHLKVDLSFFSHLNEIGLIEIKEIEKLAYIPEDKVEKTEKMIRMYQELDLNIESIDVVFNLLQKIENLQKDLILVKNRLKINKN